MSFFKSFSIALTAVTLSMPGFAHTIKAISSMSSERAQSFLNIADKLDSKSEWVVSQAYQIKEINPERKKGETLTDMYIRVLKYALHKDHPITGDDGGYSFSTIAKGTLGSEIRNMIDIERFTEDKTSQSTLVQSITGITNSKSMLTVLYGTGSGNNTAAGIVAVIDPQSKEMVYLMESNFGSDN